MKQLAMFLLAVALFAGCKTSSVNQPGGLNLPPVEYSDNPKVP